MQIAKLPQKLSLRNLRLARIWEACRSSHDVLPHQGVSYSTTQMQGHPLFSEFFNHSHSHETTLHLSGTYLYYFSAVVKSCEF